MVIKQFRPDFATLPEMDALIRLRGITKDYRKIRALDAVSVDIGPGITGLLGPNGAGKTTLIKVILGLVHISQGSGEVLGFTLGRHARAIRSCIGYMPEDDCYVAGLSGIEMVSYAAQLSGLPRLEALRRSHEILDFCGIEQERYRPVHAYSTGMRQKLQFAQAIVHDPPLLILDEPTAGLDPEERQAMLNRIRLLARKAGKAVLLSTHILPDVQDTCDAVMILAQGRVRLVEQMDILRRPALPAYHLRIFGKSGALIKKLKQQGLDPALEEDGTLTVRTKEGQFPERVWEWARQARTGIHMLAPARNSLEQIFLEAIRTEDHAHS